MEKQNQPIPNRNAHANFRKGLSDFNDGSALSHYGGNDDYKNGNNCPDQYADNQSFDGSKAYGNDWMRNDDYDDYEEKNEQKLSA